jgi:hypothetical protein
MIAGVWLHGLLSVSWLALDDAGASLGKVHYAHH